MATIARWHKTPLIVASLLFANQRAAGEGKIN
jgi:hypothetical protein